jgi:hypothetical protein
VIGVKHAKWDERPVLVVVRKPGASLTAPALLAFLEGKIAKWWMPDAVLFVESLPHTATGKLSKLELRKQLVRDFRLPRQPPGLSARKAREVAAVVASPGDEAQGRGKAHERRHLERVARPQRSASMPATIGPGAMPSRLLASESVGERGRVDRDVRHVGDHRRRRARGARREEGAQAEHAELRDAGLETEADREQHEVGHEARGDRELARRDLGRGGR